MYTESYQHFSCNNTMSLSDWTKSGRRKGGRVAAFRKSFGRPRMKDRRCLHHLALFVFGTVEYLTGQEPIFNSFSSLFMAQASYSLP
jgi:hypothetical protein